MPPKRKETTEAERQIIINLRESQKSIRQIGEIVKRPYSTVKKIIDKYKNTKKLTNEPRSGRPPVLSKAQKRFIVREIKKDPKLPATKLTKAFNIRFGYNICVNTVRNVLHKVGLHGRVARKKQFISKVNKQKRLDYAKSHKDKLMEYWNRVIFTDESKFNLYGNDGTFKV